MRVIIKPIIKPKNNPTLNFREFDDVGKIEMSRYHLIRLYHELEDIQVLIQVPTDCYVIIEGLEDVTR